MTQPAYRAFDVVYHTHDTKPLLARLYLPASPPPYPAVVEVHGGGWTTNDRLSNKAIHEALAQAGIAVMSIDFRMPPEAKYPASIADVNVAIRWLKSNAPAFGIEPDQVGAIVGGDDHRHACRHARLHQAARSWRAGNGSSGRFTSARSRGSRRRKSAIAARRPGLPGGSPRAASE